MTCENSESQKVPGRFYEGSRHRDGKECGSRFSSYFYADIAEPAWEALGFSTLVAT